MKVYLKVKIKSLAAESAIIRKDEQRHRGDLRTSLYLHRILEVRREARSAGLAYGFLRGRDYRRLEAKSYTAPDWSRVEGLIKKYGEGDARERMQKFSEWRAAAEA